MHSRSYSVLCCELASQGYIIFSMQHDGELFTYHNFYFKDAKTVEATKLDLIAKRVANTLNLVNGLKKDKKRLLNLIFSNDSVEADLNHMYMIGHDLGASTAYKVALEENKIEGGLIMIDPILPCELDKYT